MTLFVITLGFEEKFAVRMITRHGLDRGDRILLVTGPPAAPSDRAIDFLSDFISRYYGSEVAVEVLRADPARGSEGLVSVIHEAVTGRVREGERVVFNLSGGMRSICLAALLAAQLLALSGTPVEVELETEDSSALLSVPTALLNLPRVARELTPEKIEIIRELTGRETTAKKLSERTGRDETTLSRHLRALAALGLLETSGGKPATYKATKLAQLLANTLEASNRKRRTSTGREPRLKYEAAPSGVPPLRTKS